MIEYIAIYSISRRRRKITSNIAKTGSTQDRGPPLTAQWQKNIIETSQGCRIEMSVVSDQGRSVVLHNIVMVIRHHLKNIFWLAHVREIIQKLLLTSNGWPITRKSHILKLPALAPNRSSNHSLNCTWETFETCQQCAFVPGERCTWSQWTAKAWASSVEQKRCTRGRRRRRETRSWSLRHETNLIR